MHWFVDGQRVEQRGDGKNAVLVVQGSPTPVRLAESGTTRFLVGTREVEASRRQGFLSSETTLSVRGEAIAAADEGDARREAPAGALCAGHPAAPAAMICTRCGAFACAECSALDGVRCRACAAKPAARPVRTWVEPAAKASIAAPIISWVAFAFANQGQKLDGTGNARPPASKSLEQRPVCARREAKRSTGDGRPVRRRGDRINGT